MKVYSFISPILRGMAGLVAFLVGIGWAAFLSVHAIVKAEGRDVRQEFQNFRSEDMKQINARFDETQALIREMVKKDRR